MANTPLIMTHATGTKDTLYSVWSIYAGTKRFTIQYTHMIQVKHTICIYTIRTYVHTCVFACWMVYVYISHCTHTHTHTRTHACMHTRTHAHTHAHTHARTHAHMHTHTILQKGQRAHNIPVRFSARNVSVPYYTACTAVHHHGVSRI